MESVLVVGESLVDVIRSSEGNAVETRPGGAPLNVAVGLARLGVPTSLHTAYGQDAHGDLVHRHLTDSGVRVVTDRTGEPTSVADALLDAAGAAAYRFDLAWDPPPVTLPDGLGALHVGSLGTVLEPGAAVVRDAVDRAAMAGILVTYDPNVRPATSPDGERAWRGVREWAAAAHVVKLSDDDAAHLRPGASPEDVVDDLLAGERTDLVVVTSGRGASLATARHRVEVTAPSVDVVDTVGAGDSFMSALVAALAGSRPAELSREALQRIGDFACTAAAITCSRQGADPPALVDLPQGVRNLTEVSLSRSRNEATNTHRASPGGQ